MNDEIMNRRNSEYKELSFDTAIRNPERYADLFSIISKYNGTLLNDENILNIMLELYENKIMTSPDYDSDKLKNDNEKKNRIIEINSSRNSDGHFPRGYASRFWTYMRTPSEFGFLYAQYNKNLQIGEVTKMLVSGKIDAQEAFSMQSMKYNRKSPYRNVSNDYNYFKYIVRILKKLKQLGRRMSYNQFVLSLFSLTDDVDAYIDVITNNSFSDELQTYEYIKDNYPNVNSQQTVMRDYPDVVLRMLRITGFVNIINNGVILIELNEQNENYINKLLDLDFNLTDDEKIYSKLYYDKLNILDNIQLSVIESNKKDESVVENYNQYIDKILDEYKLDEDKVLKNLLALCTGRNTDENFKYITAPLKLEFFISLYLYIKFGKKFEIRPNFKIDDYGIPISHAPGNMGDIEVLGSDLYWLLEVTLIRNKTQQLNNETINLFRHINSGMYKFKYLSLLAPYIHSDTEGIFKAATVLEMSENGLKNFYAKPYTIDEFIEVSKNNKNFEDMEQYTLNILDKLKEILFD